MKTFCIIVLFLVSVVIGRGATYTAESTALSAVEDAIALASDNDTVIIPPGSAVWTSTLTVDKGINLIGSNYSDSGTPTIMNDDTYGTIITDAVGGNGNLMLFTTTAGKSYRLSQMSILGGSKPAGTYNLGAIRFTGTSTSIKVDHIKTTNLGAAIGSPVTPFYFSGALNGVVYNNWYVKSSAGVLNYIFHGSLFNDTDGWGDNSWENAAGWGGSNFMFFENCHVDGGSTGIAFTDGWLGCRFVVRHCTLNNSNVQNHGTESPQRPRSGRAMEVYNNTFIVKNNLTYSDGLFIRGGSALIHGNAFQVSSGSWLNQPLGMYYYRHSTRFQPWNICDGTMAWDEADLTDGAGTPGGANDGVFESGALTATSSAKASDNTKSWGTNVWTGYSIRTTQTYTATSGGLGTVTVSGESWPSNHWNGYIITKVSTNEKGYVSATTGGTTLTLDSSSYYRPTFAPGDVFVLSQGALIISNTSNELTLSGTFNSQNYTLRSGLDYEIRKVTQGLDQPGMGVGDSMIGTFPNHQDLNQQLEPIYFWNNTLSSNIGRTVGRSAIVGTNVHYYLSAPGFAYTTYTYPHPLRDDATPDIIPPGIQSASINGAILTIQLTESCTGGAANQFSLSSGTLSNYNINDTIITMTLTPPATFLDPTYTLNYTAGTIEDLSSNPMDNQSGLAVVNTTSDNQPSTRNLGRIRGKGKLLSK